MGQAATKAKEARAEAKSKPKNHSRNVKQQKIKSAEKSGMLSLASSKLKKVPSEVSGLTNLRTLDLSDNQIDELPMECGSLVNLKTLKLGSNSLTRLPDLSTLTALTTLILDNNPLMDLSQPLPPNLTKLSLKQNNLQTISDSIMTLGHLKELDLTGNSITAIPDAIQNLADIETFMLDDNRVQNIPNAMAACTKLKILSVKRNQIKATAPSGEQSIAKAILDDSNVQILNLDRNPMTKYDLEAMDGIDAFMARRKMLKDKGIHAGVATDVSLCGLD